MNWLSDRAVDQLREAAAWPELDDRYTITGVAGHGGMGTVYVARDQVLDRDVAVKVLDVADHTGSRAARLTREAHILARLDHPGIVPIHDAGAGAIIGLVAQKTRSMAITLAVGVTVGAFLAYLVTIGSSYLWEIVLPGSAVGLIVGFASVKYRGPMGSQQSEVRG